MKKRIIYSTIFLFVFVLLALNIVSAQTERTCDQICDNQNKTCIHSESQYLFNDQWIFHPQTCNTFGKNTFHCWCADETTNTKPVLDALNEVNIIEDSESQTERTCEESDNGRDYFNRGKILTEGLIGSGEGSGGEDYCVKEDGVTISEEGIYLVEFFCCEGYCVDNEKIKCLNGCENGACRKIEPNNTEPIEIPENSGVEIIESNITNAEKAETFVEKDICEGCILDNKCYPIGYRMENTYCDNQEFFNQKEADISCNNNFECSSNLCIDGQCVSSGLWQKIISFFKNLFG